MVIKTQMAVEERLKKLSEEFINLPTGNLQGAFRLRIQIQELEWVLGKHE
jgi:hypothetical protein